MTTEGTPPASEPRAAALARLAAERVRLAAALEAAKAPRVARVAFVVLVVVVVTLATVRGGDPLSIVVGVLVVAIAGAFLESRRWRVRRALDEIEAERKRLGE